MGTFSRVHWFPCERLGQRREVMTSRGHRAEVIGRSFGLSGGWGRVDLREDLFHLAYARHTFVSGAGVDTGYCWALLRRPPSGPDRRFGGE